MRVPPTKVGLTSVIARTFAVGAAVVAPTVVTWPAPYPYIFCSALSLIAIVSTAFLPPAGLYLPSVVETGKNSVQLIDRMTEQTYMQVSHMATYTAHSMSFNETFTEKRLKV